MQRFQSKKEPRAEGPGLASGFGLLPDAAAAVFGHHGLAWVAAEGFAELGEVLDCAFDAPLPGGVGVGFGAVDGGLLGFVLAPDLAEADEEALGGGVAVLFRGGGGVLGGEGVEQGLVGDADAAVVGGVFTQGEVAVEVLAGGYGEAVVFLGLAFGAVLEFGEVFGRPPDA